jgi:hypothetical protein
MASRAWAKEPFENKLIVASAMTPAHTVIFITEIPDSLSGFDPARTRKFGPESERIADKM